MSLQRFKLNSFLIFNFYLKRYRLGIIMRIIGILCCYCSMLLCLLLWPFLTLYAEEIDTIEQAKLLLTQAKAEATQAKNYPAVLAQALYKQGEAYQALEQNDQALVVYKNALELQQLYLADSPELANTLYQLGRVHNSLGSYIQALSNFERARELANKLRDKHLLAATSLGMSRTLWRQGNYEPALAKALEGLRLYKSLNDKNGIATAFHDLGSINDLLKNYDKALEFHQQSLALRKELNDKKSIATSLNSIGIVYYFQKKYDKASLYYQQALEIKTALEDDKGAAKTLNNLGLVKKEQGNYEAAIEYFFQSLEINNKLGDKYEISNISNNIGNIFQLKKDYSQAEIFLQRALQLARQIDAKDLIRENYEFYSALFSARGDFKTALDYFKLAANVKSDLLDEEKGKAIADMQTKYESEQKAQEIALLQRENNIKQLELERQTLLRNSSLIGFTFVLVMAVVMLYLYIVKKKAHTQLSELYSLISQEKAKSDQLLLNILPARVANDLKELGKTEPESFEDVTVFFSDIVGFTKTSAQLDPKILINELNKLFTAFDNIVERNHCERIKTIGDAYLCVCGMPEENPQHAENIVRSAIEIVHYMQSRNLTSEVQWQIRIGIHTGRVVGGVVGVKKYIYDVFGDTINTASRMESNSEPMRINLSEVTYQRVKDKFSIIDRGQIEVKGKGQMQMFFIDTKYKIQ